MRTELDRARDRAVFDPLVEGARYQLARELLLAIWEAACMAARDGSGQYNAARASAFP
jgi:hypothetical protein